MITKEVHDILLTNYIEEFVIKVYNAQRRASKLRGHVYPNYTNEELYVWFLNQPNVYKLFNEYIKSGRDKWLAPSPDRLDPTKPYSLDNLQLVSWNENARNNDIFMSIPVFEYTLDGVFINKHQSAAQAGKKYSIHASLISKCCKGKMHLYNNSIWVYEEDNNTTTITERIEAYFTSIENINFGPILQVTEYGEIVNEWESVLKMKNLIGFKFYRILKAVRTVSRTGGFFFIRKDLVTGNYIKEVITNLKHRHENQYKSITKYTIKGILVKQYVSLITAFDDTVEVSSKALISNAASLSNKRNTAGGFIWIYDEDYTKELLNEIVIMANRTHVEAFDLSGEPIGTYETIADASRKTGISVSDISSTINGKRFTAGGIIWIHENAVNKENLVKEKIKLNDNKFIRDTRSIDIYDLYGKFVKTIENTVVFSDLYNIGHHSVRLALSGETNFAAEYIIVYSDDVNKKEIVKKRSKNALSYKGVYEIYKYDLHGNLLRVYKDAEEACLEHGYKVSMLRRVAFGHRTTYDGFIWTHGANHAEEARKRTISFYKDKTIVHVINGRHNIYNNINDLFKHEKIDVAKLYDIILLSADMSNNEEWYFHSMRKVYNRSIKK